MGLLSMAFPWSRAMSIYIYLPYVQNAKLKVKSFFGFSLFLRQVSKSSVNLKRPGWSANLISITQKYLWCAHTLSACQKKTGILSAGRQHSSESLFFFQTLPIIELKRKITKHIRKEEQMSKNQKEKEDNRSRSEGIQLFESLSDIVINTD